MEFNKNHYLSLYPGYQDVRELNNELLLLIKGDEKGLIIRKKNGAHSNSISDFQDIEMIKENLYIIYHSKGLKSFINTDNSFTRSEKLTFSSYEIICDSVLVLRTPNEKSKLVDTEGMIIVEINDFQSFEKLNDGVIITFSKEESMIVNLETFEATNFTVIDSRILFSKNIYELSFRDSKDKILFDVQEMESSPKYFSRAPLLGDTYILYSSKEKQYLCNLSTLIHTEYIDEYKKVSGDIYIIANQVLGNAFINVKTMNQSPWGFKKSYEELSKDFLLIQHTDGYKKLIKIETGECSHEFEKSISIPEIKDLLILKNKSKSMLINLSNMKSTYWYILLYPIKASDILFIGIKEGGLKDIIRTQDLLTAGRVDFDSITIENGVPTLTSKYGSKATLDNEMKLSPWKF